MKKALAFFGLFTSFGTLICCALPALFVALGFGAALTGMIGAVPQLVWFSEAKPLVFGVGAFFLAAGGFFQWRARRLSCPVGDPSRGEACQAARDWSLTVYFTSVALFLTGAFFAFIASALL